MDCILQYSASLGSLSGLAGGVLCSGTQPLVPPVFGAIDKQ